MSKTMIVLTVLVSSLLALSSGLGPASPASKRGGFRLCGSRLVETLYMICGGEFYGPDIQVRDVANEKMAPDAYTLWLLGLPSKSSGEQQNSRLGRRHLMGVVDECCLKSCSYAVLSSYCNK